MNFYKHFLGDYARDTAHLSMLEHGAYRLMLDHYYATGKSLPADKALLYRICNASGKAERGAVDLVAQAFFPVNGDGTRHNPRADREIAETNAYAQAQAVRANKRWKKQADMPTHMPVHVPTQCPDDASHSHSNSKTKPSEPDGSLDAIWNEGVSLLTAKGLADSTARKFIGMLCKRHSANDVADAIQAAAGKVDPKGYISRILQDKPLKGAPVSRATFD